MHNSVHDKNDNIGQEVYSSDDVQGERVIEGNLLGHLHHSEDDGQVGTVSKLESFLSYIHGEMSKGGNIPYIWGESPTILTSLLGRKKDNSKGMD